MTFSLHTSWELLKETIAEIGDDDVPTLSAAIAYYTVFSLPPLLVILVGIAGLLFGPDTVQEAIMGQVGGLAGEEAGREVQTMIENAGDVGDSLGTKLLGIAALLFGATGAFAQLQKALNRAWDIEPAQGSGIRGFVMKRVLSFGMVLTIAFLLLVSLALSAFLSSLHDTIGGILPGGLSPVVWQLINAGVSIGVITLLFAALFVLLPDAEIQWRDVWIGAAVTAIFFTVGKWAIGLYLGTSNPGSAFGAAGSLALILVWVYYSALILLAGAEFTQVWARRFGSRIEAEEGAVRAEEENDKSLHPYAQPRDPEPY